MRDDEREEVTHTLPLSSQRADVSERFLHYRVLALVGSGGMGTVYKAEDSKLGRIVALKRVAAQAGPSARARLLREARAASALNHPNIVTVHAIEEDQGVDLLIMEFIEGEPLDARLRRGPVPLPELLAIGADVADALAHAHAHGLVHRDIKPGNIIVTPSGRAKVVDFGVVKAAPMPGAAGLDLTAPGAPVGSLPYMSPEQLRGEEIDGRSDLFSLGCVLYEMATGRRVWNADDLPELIRRLTSCDPVPPGALAPGLPVDVEAVILRALAKEPGRRPAGAAELARALRELQGAPRAPELRVQPAVDTVVAVLPFVDRSAEPGGQHLGEGLAEEILGVLSRIGGIRVVARATSFKLAAEGADVDEMRRRLGVTALVEGRVRRSGDRVRIGVSVIDARSGHQRFSQTLEGALADILSLEEEVAALVAAQLVQTQPPRPQARRAVSYDAYELYLQGRYNWNRRPGDALWRALDCFEKAAAAAPDFAAAWAGMADVYATLGSWEAGILPHAEAQEKARAYAERALAIDPTLADAHATRAYCSLHYARDVRGAETELLRALALDPGCGTAHHWLAHSLVAEGRFEEALAAGHNALRADPMNLLLMVHLAWHHHFSREPARLVEQAERVIRLEPRYHWGHYFAAWGAEALGEPARAVDCYREAVRCSDDNPVMVAGLGRGLALAGDERGAQRIIAMLAQKGDLFAYEIAMAHLAGGDRPAALEWIGRARAARSGWMVYLDVDPRVDPIREALA